MGQALGKPPGCRTSSELVEAIIQSILRPGHGFSHTDVLFDRYNKLRIKSATREKCTKSLHPIQKQIENERIPLPINWSIFMTLPQNKANLAEFLSQVLIEKVPHGKCFSHRQWPLDRARARRLISRHSGCY